MAGVDIAIESIHRQIGIRLAASGLDSQGHRNGDGDERFCTARQSAVIGLAAPELRTVQVRPKAIITLGQLEFNLTIYIDCVAAAGIERFFEGIHRKLLLLPVQIYQQGNFVALNYHIWYIITMKFEELLQKTAHIPVFETGLLLAGDVDPADVRRQLSRWTRSGQVIQLRRGVYTLAEPYRHIASHPFVLANALMPGSYVSLQSALAYHDLIPEFVPVTMSITTRRPSRWDTQLGSFLFRHLAPHLYAGYERIEVLSNQPAFVACPEKALLDLIHLTPGGENPAYLDELRLQHLDRLDTEKLHQLTVQSGKPKWERAVEHILNLVHAEGTLYHPKTERNS